MYLYIYNKYQIQKIKSQISLLSPWLLRVLEHPDYTDLACVFECLG